MVLRQFAEKKILLDLAMKMTMKWATAQHMMAMNKELSMMVLSRMRFIFLMIEGCALQEMIQ